MAKKVDFLEYVGVVKSTGGNTPEPKEKSKEERIEYKLLLM